MSFRNAAHLEKKCMHIVLASQGTAAEVLPWTRSRKHAQAIPSPRNSCKIFSPALVYGACPHSFKLARARRAENPACGLYKASLRCNHGA